MVRRDTFALIPASQLPFRQRWETIVDGLPAGEALLVVPAEASPLRQVMHAVAPALRARGRRITAVAVERPVPR